MPQFDVTIRAEWKKGSIEKTMEGEVHSKITLYKKIENDYKNDATDINKYTGAGSNNYENNVYYYYGPTENNNVLFGNYPPKIPESDLKPLPPPSGFVVLDNPVVPETESLDASELHPLLAIYVL